MPQKASGVVSRVADKQQHTVSDLDGEIFLKKVAPAMMKVNGDETTFVPDSDVNRDGHVNIDDMSKPIFHVVILAIVICQFVLIFSHSKQKCAYRIAKNR